MRHAPGLLLAVFLAGCAATVPRVEEPARSRAETYARRAEGLARAGDRPAALHFATRALVVRLAACGYDCPDVAYSFVQLGDLRFAQAEPEHSAQSYARALEVLEPHRASHGAWIAAVRRRLVRACADAARPPAVCAGPRPGEIR